MADEVARSDPWSDAPDNGSVPGGSPADPSRVLILVTGLPGAGKTTLGAALAKALDVPFVSLDSIKERLYAAAPERLDSWELRLAAEGEVGHELGRTDCAGMVVDMWVAPGRDEERVRALLRKQPATADGSLACRT